jgi:hypothetical protein
MFKLLIYSDAIIEEISILNSLRLMTIHSTVKKASDEYFKILPFGAELGM